MSPSTIGETEKRPTREIMTLPLQDNKNLPTLCGPGCACGKTAQSGKWKIVIMLIILAAVAIASIYKEIL